MSYFPASIVPADTKNETFDVPGNDSIMNARDYNRLDDEIRAIEGTIGILGSTDIGTVLGSIYDIRRQISEVMSRQPTIQKPFDFIVSPGGGGDASRIDAVINKLPVAGGTIRLDSGNHNVASKIDMPVGQNVSFVGEGMSTLITIADTITGFGLIRPTSICFSDMKFKAATGSTTAVAIEINNGGTLYLTRCAFEAFEYAVKFTGTGGHVYITDCYYQDSLVASLHIAVSGGVMVVNGTRIIHNSQSGIGINATDGQVIVGSTKIDNADFGIKAIGSADLVLNCSNALISTCAKAALLSGAATATVVGNTLKGNTGAITNNSTGATTVANNTTL